MNVKVETRTVWIYGIIPRNSFSSTSKILNKIGKFTWKRLNSGIVSTFLVIKLVGSEGASVFDFWSWPIGYHHYFFKMVHHRQEIKLLWSKNDPSKHVKFWCKTLKFDWKIEFYMEQRHGDKGVTITLSFFGGRPTNQPTNKTQNRLVFPKTICAQLTKSEGTI